MKSILTPVFLAALVLSVQSFAASATEVPPIDSPLGIVSAAVGVGFAAEKSCTEDKEMSCTEEAKKAGQNLVDYVRGKKNGWRSLEKKTKKFRKLFKF